MQNNRTKRRIARAKVRLISGWFTTVAFLLTAHSACGETPAVPAGFTTVYFNGDGQFNPAEDVPADRDPEGNWSKVAGGLQLSVRFRTNIFQAGEFIHPDVILRNVGDTPVQRSYHPVPTRRSQLCRFIVTLDGEEIPSRDRNTLASSPPLHGEINPKTQWRQSVALSGFHNLHRAGTYVITGVTEVGNGDGSTEIRTPSILIQVVGRNVSTATDLTTPRPPRITNPAARALIVSQHLARTHWPVGFKPGTFPEASNHYTPTGGVPAITNLSGTITTDAAAPRPSETTPSVLKSRRKVLSLTVVGLLLTTIVVVLLIAKSGANRIR